MPEVDEDVASRHEGPQPRLVDPALANEPIGGKPEALKPPVEIEPGRGGAYEQERQVGMPLPHCSCRAEELRDPLARVDDSEAADHRSRSDALRSDGGNRPCRMRDD